MSEKEKIVKQRSHTFHIVDAVPKGYSVWNIRQPEGYLALCIPDPIKKGYNIDTRNIKCVKSEGAQVISTAVNWGYPTLEAIRKGATEGNEYCVAALPFIEKLPGAENLVKFKVEEPDEEV